jgi:hypothetical protein
MRIAVFALTGLFLGTLGTASAAPPTPEIIVVNDSANAIPVTGDVVATLSGAVAVDDVPDELTDRLDLILDRLENLSGQATGTMPVANYVRYHSAATAEGDALTFLFNRRVAIRSVLISSDDDKIVTYLCDTPAPDDCFTSLSSSTGISFGSADFVESTESVVNFPLAVPAQSVKVTCREAGDGGVCQYNVAILGRIME